MTKYEKTFLDDFKLETLLALPLCASKLHLLEEYQPYNNIQLQNHIKIMSVSKKFFLFIIAHSNFQQLGIPC